MDLASERNAILRPGSGRSAPTFGRRLGRRLGVGPARRLLHGVAAVATAGHAPTPAGLDFKSPVSAARPLRQSIGRKRPAGAGNNGPSLSLNPGTVGQGWADRRPRQRSTDGGEQGRGAVEQGRAVFEQGHAVFEQGHAVFEHDRAVSEYDRAVSAQGRAIPKHGRAVSEQGRAVSVQGRAVSEHDRAVSKKYDSHRQKYIKAASGTVPAPVHDPVVFAVHLELQRMKDPKRVADRVRDLLQAAFTLLGYSATKFLSPTQSSGSGSVTPTSYQPGHRRPDAQAEARARANEHKAEVLVMEASKSMLCTVAWNHYIDYLMARDKVAVAFRAYNDMKKRAQQPDSHTILFLLRGLANNAHLPSAIGRALALYHSMSSPGSRILPTIIHSNAALKVCARANDLDGMRSVVVRMPRKGPGSPDNLTFTTILNSIRYHTVTGISKERSFSQEAGPRSAAIVDGRRVWAEVVSRWSTGYFGLDEELVCAMGRLLLVGLHPSDWDDVLSLVQQTMNISRPLPRVGTSKRGRDKSIPEISVKHVAAAQRLREPDEKTSLTRATSEPSQDFAPIPAVHHPERFDDIDASSSYADASARDRYSPPASQQPPTQHFDILAPHSFASLEPKTPLDPYASSLIQHPFSPLTDQSRSASNTAALSDGKKEGGERRPKPRTPWFAKPGRNTLSLLLEACHKSMVPQAAHYYWHLLVGSGPVPLPQGGPRDRGTISSDERADYGVIPDGDNLQAYLRILRQSKDSTAAIALLRTYCCTPAGSSHAAALIPPAWKILRLAMSVCNGERDDGRALAAAAFVMDLADQNRRPADSTVMTIYLDLLARAMRFATTDPVPAKHRRGRATGPDHRHGHEHDGNDNAATTTDTTTTTTATTTTATTAAAATTTTTTTTTGGGGDSPGSGVKPRRNLAPAAAADACLAALDRMHPHILELQNYALFTGPAPASRADARAGARTLGREAVGQCYQAAITCCSSLLLLKGDLSPARLEEVWQREAQYVSFWKEKGFTWTPPDGKDPQSRRRARLAIPPAFQ